jgi:glycosyltransferase involved in cell wall biosynthesis
MKIAILCFHGPIEHWDDKSINTKGLPGSEEAVVYLAKEFAKDNKHKVDVYGSPKSNIIEQNPRYLNNDLWENSENNEYYDLVLSWRSMNLERAKRRSEKVFLWLHDMPFLKKEDMQKNFLEKFDSILFLSEKHKQQYSYYANFRFSRWKIIGNGLVPEHFPYRTNIWQEKEQNPYSLGYFSNYARGLLVLLVIWPDIKKAFPEATLTVCYGRIHWGVLNKEQESKIFELLDSLKSQDVIETGMISHQELNEIMRKTSIWTYPCTMIEQETFCITAIKSQASGMIPVIVKEGVFKEVVDQENCYSIEKLEIESYKNLLLKAMKEISENKEVTRKRRKKLREFAIQFSWSRTARRILEEYEEIKSGKNPKIW